MIEPVVTILIVGIAGLCLLLLDAQRRMSALRQEAQETREHNRETTSALNTALAERDRLGQMWQTERDHLKEREEVFEAFRKHVSEREAYQAQIYQQHVNQAAADARTDALKRSRSVMRGQATEHLAPLIQSEWPYKDFRFLGNPIDYVIFSGASAVTDGEGDTVDEVVLLDIKTGKSQLSKVQRRIRDAVRVGNVDFATYNPDTEELRRWI